MFLKDRDLVMYILVNSDIEISKGKLSGQVGHAVFSYCYEKMNNNHDLFSDYLENNQKKVILKCKQNKLEKLEKEGFITIRDNGLTELEPNTLTCVNLGIIDRNKEMPKWLKRLRLY